MGNNWGNKIIARNMIGAKGDGFFGWKFDE